MAPPSREALEYAINHVFLPPKLPQELEVDFATHDGDLVQTALRALKELRISMPVSARAQIDRAIGAIDLVLAMHSSADGYLSETEIVSALRNLSRGSGSPIPIHIRAQNAGLLITRTESTVSFECFEISALNNAVMTTRGRLKRTFPGSAISLDISTATDSELQAALAHTLSKMSHQVVPGMQPQTLKGGRAHDEERDTTSPAALSELLFGGMLKAIGRPIVCSTITKNTRDDVLWSNAKLPWRRSSTWLFIRVTLQLLFSRSENQIHDIYKLFMISMTTRLLDQARLSGLGSDMLYSMNAKVARRIQKLGAKVPADVAKRTMEILNNSHQLLSARWFAIQLREKTSAADVSDLATLEFGKDLSIQLPLVDHFIDSIALRPPPKGTAVFAPSHSLHEFSPDTIPVLEPASNGQYELATLQGFEDWVALNTRRMFAARTADSACPVILKLLTSYHARASVLYQDNAEGMSIMILTILELWIAGDKLAISACKILTEYSHGLPLDVLQSLVLPSREHLTRLRAIETYLYQRDASAGQRPALMANKSALKEFAARCFDASVSCQELRDEIEEISEMQKQIKLRELENALRSYKRLEGLRDQHTCLQRTVTVASSIWPYETVTKIEHDDEACQFCRLQERLRKKSIPLHEEPLPANDMQAKVVVFELRGPVSHVAWRDSTAFVLHDVLRVKYAEKVTGNDRPLSDDPHVGERSTAPQGRIILVSNRKAQASTHYKWKKIASIRNKDTANLEEVLYQNDTNYEYYDLGADCFIVQLLRTQEAALSCTYRFEEPSGSLNRFLFRPSSMPNGVSPNQVIASQSQCPESLALEEYKELCTIAFGHHIQWPNILVQLAAPTVDLRKEATALMMFQCIYQAGPEASEGSDEILRASHALLNHGDFSRLLLSTLEAALQRVKENWESSNALAIFAAVASRVLSMASSSPVHAACLAFLAKVRSVAFAWVTLLRQKSREAVSQSELVDFTTKTMNVALVCILSFDVDGKHLTDILAAQTDAAILLQCSSIISERRRTTKSSVLQILGFRAKRLLARSLPCLKRNHGAIDDALQWAWSAHNSSHSGWRQDDLVSHSWITTDISMPHTRELQKLHYDLLTGELLVNGSRLVRPPAVWEQDPSYLAMFGTAPLEVVSAAVPGMRFTIKRDYQGHVVHIGMTTSSVSPRDLLVRASSKFGNYELVPSRLLQGTIPDAFVSGFAHWYNMGTGALELRPSNDPWNFSQRNVWEIKRQSDGWTMSKDRKNLIGLHTDTLRIISRVLSPLVDPSQVHVTFESWKRQVEVEVPSLQLGFLLAPGDSKLHSKDFSGFFVDVDQSIRTLCGLSSKLVLSPEKGDRRLVLLPEGDVWHELRNGHVSVGVAKGTICRIHPVYVDARLGRLVDNGSLQSKLLLAYFSALTSYCLPDPLTSCTGTEQALSLLNSASVHSFEKLEAANIGILSRLAALTPSRSFYPPEDKVMQTVVWNPKLDFLSQHGGFLAAVRSILKRAKEAMVFYPEARITFPVVDHVSKDLFDRDMLRTATFRVSGFGAEMHTSSFDSTYESRDLDISTARATRACLIARMANGDIKMPCWPVLSPATFWASMSTLSSAQGYDGELDHGGIRFDAELLAGEASSVLRQLLPLSKAMAGSGSLNKYSLLIWLSSLAFSSAKLTGVLQIVALIRTAHKLESMEVPTSLIFHPGAGLELTSDQLATTIETNAARPFEETSDFTAPRRPDNRGHLESPANWKSRIRGDYQRHKGGAARLLANMIMKQWSPKSIVKITEPVVKAATSGFIDVAEAVQTAQGMFQDRINNRELWLYLSKANRALSTLTVTPVTVESTVLTILPTAVRKAGFTSVDDLFSGTPSSSSVLTPPELITVPRASGQDAGCMRSVHLRTLIEQLRLEEQPSQHEEAYIVDLEESLHALESRNEGDAGLAALPNRRTMDKHLVEFVKYSKDVFSSLEQAMRSTETDAGRQIQHWPRISPLLFLQQLSRKRWPKLSSEWKGLIVQYALAIGGVQRAERLLKAERTSVDDLFVELQNPGHTNWSPFEYPEFLLLEVESGIIIREVQEQIAEEMRIPSGQNAVMQLNMGEGKSSVIVPMVAAALADGSQLVRVVVAKPQSKQMVEMLKSKLGGLLDRRIHYLPFSRSLKPSQATAEAIERLCQSCMKEGGILLLQPEHILSFKLTGPECFIVGNEAAGRALLRIQEFFDTRSRDIVDESDENFSVKFELIYTMGLRRAVEMSPQRWVYVQKILDFVKTHAAALRIERPQAIEYIDRGSGGFPRIRILREEAGHVLVGRIAEHVCDLGLPGLPLPQQAQPLREAVLVYITKPELAKEEISAVQKSVFWSEHTKGALLLLRGLFAGGILEFVFGGKRWRVNYGLTSRSPLTKLAVPYRAKDTPSPRSEFSHPEVVILLTSLSYYYEGLSDDDLYVVLGHLINSDRADDEWQSWLDDIAMPTEYCSLQGINLRDRTHCEQSIFPLLRHSKAAVDYYLSRIVFPKEMKEYDNKLSASGWDIGRVKRLPTTGFSGTNDSKSLLPLDVTPRNLATQAHTNALVLEHLLSPKNSVALFPGSSTVFSTDAERLLTMVMALVPPPEVILDVGAQILELDNLNFAKEWLKSHPDHQKEAAVFCSSDDELSVVNRKGQVELLQTSSFASRLHVCLVYLDEAHTRGIDLKLPPKYRAAVTLGSNLSKDKIVQACMRMRKLGRGQTVVFCVPEEIHNRILERRDLLRSNVEGRNLNHVFVGQDRTQHKASPKPASVSDVLSWAISETQAEISRSIAVWAVHGHRHIVQEKLWKQVRAAGSLYPSQQVARKFLEPEALTLERRYAPRDQKPALTRLAEHSDKSFNEISARCRTFNDLEFRSKRLQEEQERELSPEVVAEPIIQRVAAATPAKHCLHRDLIAFVESGVIKHDSAAYFAAFNALANTTAASNFDVTQLRAPAYIYATADYARVVEHDEARGFEDQYIRPVQWILTGRRIGDDVVGSLIVISPWEAEHLFERVQQSYASALHAYRPRTNLGHPALDELDFCTIAPRPMKLFIPPQLLIQLNVFAGALYFSSYQEYQQTCMFLGLAYEKALPGCEILADGFIKRDAQGQIGGGSTSKVRVSPIKFIKSLMTTIRRNGESISKTHMGALLEGRLLQRSDFEN
ncbi:unnamed protein product [Zymoseptoria tritici ST99CH_3D1]|nr:unnamed protein product [Zymoseptoria tritici ST99CH_3D1]